MGLAGPRFHTAHEGVWSHCRLQIFKQGGYLIQSGVKPLTQKDVPFLCYFEEST